MTLTRLPAAKDKPLFTPGPLTTSLSVKQAMLHDLGSRDQAFIDIVRDVRQQILELAGVSQEAGYEAVLMQGSGTFGVEALISGAVPPGGKWLIVANGAYGERMAAMCAVHGIDCAVYRVREDQLPDPAEVDSRLKADPAIDAVAMVHGETTTGLINPIRAMGEAVAARGKTYAVDSMSAFGAVEFDFRASRIDFLVSSSNKCIEGVPGFSFCVARRAALQATQGWARTLSLDLLAQWKGLEANGQFRFTPPTHSILAFHQALAELRAEGGVKGRAARYQRNHQVLAEGMRRLGFRTYLKPAIQGPIITSFHFPDDPKFSFEAFYSRLNERGYVIYPGKVSNADCFRIGTIGRLFPSDMWDLLAAVEAVVRELEIHL